MIKIKTPEEIEIMAEGGKILAKIMQQVGEEVRPGVATKELNGLAESLVLKYGGKCSFRGYRGFPTCLCTSVNEEIVHAVPSGRILKEGDIISLDLGILYKGFHTDMAITVPLGKISPKTKKLIEVTEKALQLGIEKIKAGNKIGDISKTIQKYVEVKGFNVVRELCGHGIGRKIHEDPEILNSVSFDEATVDKVKYTDDGNITMTEGMVLCLEPMVTMGDWRIKETADGFGFKTKDDSLSCHFEHTIALTKNGARVLTVVK